MSTVSPRRLWKASPHRQCWRGCRSHNRPPPPQELVPVNLGIIFPLCYGSSSGPSGGGTLAEGPAAAVCNGYRIR